VSGPTGLLLVDKPAGPTSHDVVARVRRVTGQRRVGHAGTLDPAASGLLPLVLGAATRLVRFLPSSPKVYIGTLLLGARSDTDDAAGTIVERWDGPLPAPHAVIAAAAELVGRSRQLTPAVSARKVEGQRLYRLARRGVAVAAPEVPIEVHRFELRPAPDAAADDGRYAFLAEVSAGTYIRGLARDLGLRLGCGGLLESLRRVRVGPLDVEEALTLEPRGHATEGGAAGSGERERLLGRLIPPESMPLSPPRAELADAAAARAFVHGNAVPCPGPDGTCRTIGPDGRLLGVAERSAGLLRPRVVLTREA
jgi:tRNA pseudouridine55 synthase